MVQVTSSAVWPWIWGGPGLAGPAPVPDDDVEQGAFHQHENSYHRPEKDVEELELLLGNRSYRVPSRLESLATGRCQEEKGGQ